MGFAVVSLFVFYVLLQQGWAATTESNIPINFYQNYQVTWGFNHVSAINRGTEVQLSLDMSSGAGFESKQSYGSGFFHMNIKLPDRNSAGVVTAFYLTSKGNKHDELDFEFLGNVEGKPYTLQTNVFANGEGNREQRIALWFDPTKDFHLYGILWNQHQIVFYVDEIPIRVYKNNSAIGVAYPSRPMQVEGSLWDGDSWATDGGRTKTDWRYAPFIAHFQGFAIGGCSIPNSMVQIPQQCYSSAYWWNQERYWKLNHKQQTEYENVRNNSATHGGLRVPHLIGHAPRSRTFSIISTSPMAILYLRAILLLYLIGFCSFFYANAVHGSVIEEEEFSEELLLRPLPDRKVLSHFHFRSRAPPTSSNGRHHHLFPKAISQLVQKFRLKEMELSFTQGRWNYDLWGGFDPISSNNAKPPGVELWAVFAVPQHHVDASWKNLTHALSGLFCASINFLESSTTYSAPDWGFRPASGSLRYGTLPREAVCTENLTPWLKLLPCRDKAGIAALLDRPSIYKGYYHSQRLRLTSTEFDLEGVDSGIVLEQTLTVVLQPNDKRDVMTSLETKLHPSWSLTSMFGRKIKGRCVLAKSSNVFLQLDKGLVAEIHNMQKENKISVSDNLAHDGLKGNHGFALSVKPDRVLEEVNGSQPSVLYEFSMDSESFDLGLTWKLPVVWSCQQAPLHASRFLMGSGNERGAIAISLKSTELSRQLLHSDMIEGSCKLQVNVFQVVPWYIKVYYHSLQVFIDERPQAVLDVVEKMRVSPSEDKVSPGVMEMILKFPCGMKSASITLEFDKGFLHIDEYPPDANQGFDIPSAIISYPNFHASIRFVEDKSLDMSPILGKFQEDSSVLSYTEVLLVPLTTPDFSMPYNVITITCTVFALYFGSLLNVLRRRVAEEERLLKTQAAKTGLLAKLSAKLRRRPLETAKSSSSSSSLISSKLILKVVLVAGIAIVWQFYRG
ncbi:hypothetical protein FNV43_RR23052 [Rhamnella rubrinervis]|uniref:GH16 domain-containing protein n=1 Tax=Rhamnella rubrinervis TaxID=2594499 RepID=A0A8K0DY76_9ROSA|nr:hypothetical protein FNV43_RR23052 [Rhamnella rubrinervis]